MTFFFIKVEALLQKIAKLTICSQCNLSLPRGSTFQGVKKGCIRKKCVNTIEYKIPGIYDEERPKSESSGW